MTRAHDACRRDLMNARHRVSQDAAASRPGLSEADDVDGRAPPLAVRASSSRAGQRAGVRRPDGRRRRADARKAAIALRLSELATDERWWPTVARLQSVPRDRHADGVLDAPRARRRLAALRAAPRAVGWLGLTPSLNQSGESSRQGAITKTGSMLARRLLVESAWHYSRQPRIGATLANRQAGQPDHILAIANRAQQRLHHVNRTDARPRQAAQRHGRRLRARTGLLPLGSRHRRLTQTDTLTGRWAGAPGHQRPARAIQL